jgi:hypothetical protein
MDVSLAMEQLGQRLDTIDGLRAYDSPPGTVNAPAAIVGYPTTYTFDATYGRGMDTFSLPVIVVVGGVFARGTRERLGEYLAGAGAKSIKGVVESGLYSAFDVVRVASAEIETVMLGDVEYLAAIFNLDIAGEGDQP